MTHNSLSISWSVLFFWNIYLITISKRKTQNNCSLIIDIQRIFEDGECWAQSMNHMTMFDLYNKEKCLFLSDSQLYSTNMSLSQKWVLFLSAGWYSILHVDCGGHIFFGRLFHFFFSSFLLHSPLTIKSYEITSYHYYIIIGVHCVEFLKSNKNKIHDDEFISNSKAFGMWYVFPTMIDCGTFYGCRSNTTVCWSSPSLSESMADGSGCSSCREWLPRVP